MTPRARRWILWLLPFLVARAFVPAGFMVSAAGGELSLRFCPSASVIAPVAAAAEAVATHDAHAHSHAAHAHAAEASAAPHADHVGATDTNLCVFAVVTGCASNDFHLANARLYPASNLLAADTVSPHANRPVRVDRIRGPPASLAVG